MRTVFDHLSTDPSVRAIVFSGSGEKGFSVGIDLKWVSGQDSPFMVEPGESVDPGRRAVTKLRRFGVEFQECISSIEVRLRFCLGSSTSPRKSWESGTRIFVLPSKSWQSPLPHNSLRLDYHAQS